MAEETDERTYAVTLANRVLDRPYIDPDEDIAVLARQLLRRHEEITRLRARESELLAQIESMRTGLDDALDKVRRRL